MRSSAVFCLTALLVASMSHPAHAGRRARRAAAVVAVTAAAAPRATVVAAAPVVVARASAVPARPDLTIAEMVSPRGVHMIIVKNIGQASSPLTRLKVDFCEPVGGAVMATTNAVVPPLQENQSVRILVHWAPTGRLKAVAYADPDSQVAETDESNNSRAIVVVGPSPSPRALEDVNVGVQLILPVAQRQPAQQ